MSTPILNRVFDVDFRHKAGAYEPFKSAKEEMAYMQLLEQVESHFPKFSDWTAHRFFIEDDRLNRGLFNRLCLYLLGKGFRCHYSKLTDEGNWSYVIFPIDVVWCKKDIEI